MTMKAAAELDLQKSFTLTGEINREDHFKRTGKLLHDIYLNKPEWGANVQIRFQNDKINAHSVVLSAHSLYFRELLQKQHPPIIVNLTGVAHVTVAGLRSAVDFIYQGVFSISPDTLYNAYCCAVVLDIRTMTQLLEEYLLKLTNRNPSVCLFALEMSFGAPLSSVQIRESVLEVCARRFPELIDHSSFCKLSLDAICALLAHDSLNVDDELQVFNSALSYLKNNRLESPFEADRVLGCVRYNLLNAKEIDQCEAESLKLGLSFSLRRRLTHAFWCYLCKKEEKTVSSTCATPRASQSANAPSKSSKPLRQSAIDQKASSKSVRKSASDLTVSFNNGVSKSRESQGQLTIGDQVNKKPGAFDRRKNSFDLWSSRSANQKPRDRGKIEKSTNQRSTERGKRQEPAHQKTTERGNRRNPANQRSTDRGIRDTRHTSSQDKLRGHKPHTIRKSSNDYSLNDETSTSSLLNSDYRFEGPNYLAHQQTNRNDRTTQLDKHKLIKGVAQQLIRMFDDDNQITKITTHSKSPESPQSAASETETRQISSFDKSDYILDVTKSSSNTTIPLNNTLDLSSTASALTITEEGQRAIAGTSNLWSRYEKQINRQHKADYIDYDQDESDNHELANLMFQVKGPATAALFGIDWNQ